MDLLEKLPELLASYSTYIVLIGGGLVEVALRLFKTEKPMSILQLISRGAKAVAALLEAVSGLLDKIVPDKVEEPKE